MKTTTLFKNGNSQAVRLPKEFRFEGISKVAISRRGDEIILKPIKKSWTSFADVPLADDDFLIERPDVLADPSERNA